MLLSLFLQRPCIKWKILIKSVRDYFSLSCACRNQTEFVKFVFRSLKYLCIAIGLKVQQRRSKGGPSTGPTCALALEKEAMVNVTDCMLCFAKFQDFT